MPLAIALLAALYAAALAVLVGLGVNQGVLALRHALADRARPGPVPDPDEASPRPPDADRRAWPAVTVQVPLYNERYVARRVIDACARLDYPRDRLELQVLDDSSDDTAQIAATAVAAWRRRGLDAVHVRRPNREGYKAGALANGLSFARGDLVAVFDADFVPEPDFLRRAVPRLRDPALGLVQARWGHRNPEASALTAAQAALLDAHFAVEQGGRHAAGWFLHFNGTAGVWRRSAIEAAGGWHADTLTEDLDLSFRAQLAGVWLYYDGALSAPADLPESWAAWRRQQARWTKGTAETARKLLGRVLRARLPRATRAQAALHLSAFAVYPAVLVLALVHAPLMTAHALGLGVPDALLAAFGVGGAGLAGVGLAHLLAQRHLHPDWPRRLLAFPWWLAASMGLAASNTAAAWEGLRRRPSPFERTPKGGYTIRQGGRAEAALAAYALAGGAALAASGAWAALPVQVLFLIGFTVSAGYDRWATRALKPDGTAGDRTFRTSPGPSVPESPA
jgi:hypothetical protein